MPCACKRGAQARYEGVVTTDGKEKVVSSSGSRATAETVGKRYAGSIIREVPSRGTGEKGAR
ncbi:hypothetical protein [Streptomyces sp. NBC_01334]|uniref:hypothetical protein n=1 Tax=Streptomyces sp. NBC_01334 TaxID=2903827 RepID=UPI002E12F22C|nr:hypothetical protein OG736_23875 [Streptomyces sp. NBC_01334]